ncbi:MAG: hypothetical protein N2663_03700 [Chlorobi bacterium]|nr:hypothetical protein [Chlorobiota bacterium]
MCRRRKQVFSIAIAATVLVLLSGGGCASVYVLSPGAALDSSAVARFNALLAESDVEVLLRGGATPAALQVQRRYRLTREMLVGIGRHDTVAVPLEYVAQLNGFHKRSPSRLAIGGLSGFLAGTIAGSLAAPAMPLPIGIGGAVLGITVAALSSQRFTIRIEHPPANSAK